MKGSKGVISILTVTGVVLLVAALTAGISLVQKSAELRRGAYFAGTTMFLKPELIETKVSNESLVSWWVETQAIGGTGIGADGKEERAKIDFAKTRICYGNHWTIDINNIANVMINKTAFDSLVGLKIVPGVGSCLEIGVKAERPADKLQSGMVQIATLRFKATGVGSGKMEMIKEESEASGANPDNGSGDKALNIESVKGLDYVVAGDVTPTKIPEPTNTLVPKPTSTATPAPGKITPTPTCAPRPGCLDQKPPCAISEPPEGWCPGPTATPTSVIGPPSTPTPAISCFDSDGGKNYEVKGYVSTGSEAKTLLWDTCTEVAGPSPTGGKTIEGGAPIPINKNLQEYYCDGIKTASEIYLCPGSCVDGACTKVTPTPGCAPKPSCLMLKPPCLIPEPPEGWCPGPTVTPTKIPTPTSGVGCKQCPSTFACYTNGREYRWFVMGYVWIGFAPVTGDVDCGGVPRPIFRGKEGADANCDGYADAYDYSIWRREYVDLGGGWQGMPPFPTWEADFTGPAARCDGKVGPDDYSLWRRAYLE